jgi:hemolysin D
MNPVTPGRLLRTAQTALEQSVSNASHEGIHLRQSPFWGRTITWALMGTAAFGFGWLALAKTDQIVSAPGKLEPVGQVNDVQMPVGGVAKAILVKEGQSVRAGQILMQLDTEATLDRRRTLEKSIQLKRNQLALKEQEMARYLQLNQTEQSVLNRNIDLNEEIMRRFDELSKEGATAELQMLQQRNRVEEIRGQLKQTQVDQRRQVAILEQSIEELRSQLAQLRNQLTELNVNIRYQAIKAPVDGVVFDLKPTTPGFVAQTSEPVMKIVPQDRLVARVQIPSESIGFVKAGQQAELSIDSFPANDFGALQGKVKRIGSDALPPDQNNPVYRFPAEISLNTQALKLKDGIQLPLQAGMSLRANIKLRKVTYLQLLLGGFQDKAAALKRT